MKVNLPNSQDLGIPLVVVPAFSLRKFHICPEKDCQEFVLICFSFLFFFSPIVIVSNPISFERITIVMASFLKNKKYPQLSGMAKKQGLWSNEAQNAQNKNCGRKEDPNENTHRNP